MRSLPRLPLLLFLFPAALLAGCLDGHKDEVVAGAAVVNLIDLQILPREGTTTVSLSGSKTLELLLKGRYRDGSEGMIDSIRAAWTIVSGAAGQVSIHGQFTALTRGSIRLKARLGLVAAEIDLLVIP